MIYLFCIGMFIAVHGLIWLAAVLIDPHHEMRKEP